MGSTDNELTVASSGENLATIRRFIGDHANRCDFSDNQVFDIKVAVGEACANAIEHGSPLGDKNAIKVKFECLGDRGIILITDEGKFKRQVIEYNANGLHHRGRGMAFMLALMDEVEVKTGSGGTTVKMTKLKQPLNESQAVS